VHIIKITKVILDDWWGYYVDGYLYDYKENFQFNDELVEKTLVLEAISKGYAINSNDIQVTWSSHSHWPNSCSESDYECAKHFGYELPLTETQLQDWYMQWVSDYDEDEDE
jgi:hypothetical protein